MKDATPALTASATAQLSMSLPTSEKKRPARAICRGIYTGALVNVDTAQVSQMLASSFSILRTSHTCAYSEGINRTQRE